MRGLSQSGLLEHLLLLEIHQLAVVVFVLLALDRPLPISLGLFDDLRPEMLCGDLDALGNALVAFVEYALELCVLSLGLVLC